MIAWLLGLPWVRRIGVWLAALAGIFIALAAIDTPPSLITLSKSIEGDPDLIFAHACKLGLEGIVSKQRDSCYRSGRRKEWLKVKCIQSDEFVVIGYELGKGFGGLGRIHLGRYQDGRLVEIGGVGTGFNERSAQEVLSRLEMLKTDKPIPGLRRKATIWTRPNWSWKCSIAAGRRMATRTRSASPTIG